MNLLGQVFGIFGIVELFLFLWIGFTAIAINKNDIDDVGAAIIVIFVGIPLIEPYLQKKLT